MTVTLNFVFTGRTRSKVLTVIQSTFAASILSFGLILGDLALAADPDPNTSDVERQKYLDILRGTKKRLETEKLLNTPTPPTPAYPAPYPSDKPSARDRMRGNLKGRIDNARKSAPKPEQRTTSGQRNAGGAAGTSGTGTTDSTDRTVGTTQVSNEQEIVTPPAATREEIGACQTYLTNMNDKSGKYPGWLETPADGGSKTVTGTAGDTITVTATERDETKAEIARCWQVHNSAPGSGHIAMGNVESVIGKPADLDIPPITDVREETRTLPDGRIETTTITTVTTVLPDGNLKIDRQTEVHLPPPVVIKAADATKVTYGPGDKPEAFFQKVEGGGWVEYTLANPNTPRFWFTQTDIDEWSIFLKDDFRDIQMKLNLYTKKVFITMPGKQRQEFRAIQHAEAANLPPAPPPPEVLSFKPTTSSVPIGQPGGVAPVSLTGGNSAAGAAAEFCWRDSYGRGIGKIPGDCKPGDEKIGLLCYDKCPRGTERVGFDCHSVCPSGYRNDGLYCRRSEYGRGVGFPWEFGDGFNDNGMRKRCEQKHGKRKCEKWGAVYYPKCKSGYSPAGCCICRPKTPDCNALGLGHRIDLSCAKKVDIGIIRTAECSSDQEYDAGLCYDKCDSGYSGVGPVCWGKTPDDWVGCGMGAAKSDFACGKVVFNQVSSVGQMAANVATAGGAGAASGASKSTKLAALKEKFSKMKAAFDKIKNMDGVRRAKQGIDGAKEINQYVTIAGHVETTENAEVVTEEDMVRLAAEILAIVDASGASGVVAAYTYAKCSEITR